MATDYEKKYNEALERAKKMMESKRKVVVEKQALETIFPELAESEDERIMKALIEVFKKKLERGFEWVEYGIPNRSVLDWTDKQKEQMPEWSKNDTVFLNEITDFFENKTVRLQHDIDMYAHWLKSLPERFSLQPKQEWSEEDEKTIDDAFCWLCEYAGSLIQKNYGKSSMLYGIANKLKSLHPQYHGDVTMTEAYKMGKEVGEASRWKPTEHQMTILKAVKEYVGKGSGYWGEGLGSLIDDLEKLM